MSRENSNASTLNARERKLPRDSQGKIVTKDSTRQQQSDEKEMQKFFETLDWCYDKVKNDPLSWNKDSLHSSRNFAQHILENQDNFPLDNEVTIECLVPSSNQTYDSTRMETLLTTGFVRSITEKSWSYGNGSDEPIVQVLHTDNGRFQTFSSGFDSVKIVCLTVIDRDGNRLLARVAAHLTDTAVHLRPGHVLRLRVFNDMLMKPHANSPPTAVIVVV
jgi:hypothetical protein